MRFWDYPIACFCSFVKEQILFASKGIEALTMDFKKLLNRYNQFGGFRLVVEYAKLHALLPAICTGIKCIAKRQSFKQIYPVALNKVEPFLIEKYGVIVQEYKLSRDIVHAQKKSKIVWFCWLQGIEMAPEIVKACYNSLKQNLPDREVTVIDRGNWTE